MTVSSEINRWDYTGNGVLVTYPFTVEIYAKTDLAVYVSGVLKTVDVDYTIAAASIENPDGGNVVFTTAPALSAPIAIVLNLPVTQLIDYVEGDAFPAETHERALDRLVKLIQYIKGKFSHVAKLGDDSPIELVMPNPAADHYIAWNSAGTNLENRTNPIELTGTTQWEVDALVTYGGGTSYTKATIDAALTAIGLVNKATLLLRPGSWTITADSDYSAYTNVTFKIPAGCTFVITALMTLTLPSPYNIQAQPNQEIFTGAGTAVFSTGGEAYLAWFSTLAKAISALASTTSNLVMNKAQSITSAHTTNANTTLTWKSAGNIITMGVGGSLTINGPVVASDNIQIFAPNSITELAAISSTAKQGMVSARWWGATGDNATNDTLGLDCAIYSANTAVATLFFPPGIYRAVAGGISTIVNCPVYGPQACLRTHTSAGGNLIEVNYQAYYSTFEMQAILGYNISSAYYSDPSYTVAVAATGLYIRSCYYARFNIARVTGFNIGIQLDSHTDDTHIASNKFEIGEFRHNNYGVLLQGGTNYIPEANNFYINFMVDNRNVAIQISDDATPASPYPVSMNYFFVHELACNAGVTSQSGIYLNGDKVEKNVFRILSFPPPTGTGVQIITVGAHDNIFDISYPNDWSKISMDAGNVFIGSSAVGLPGTNTIARSVIWAAAAPATYGYWRVGDICWNSGAAAGGSPGWVCTTAGTPGVWKAMPNLAA